MSHVSVIDHVANHSATCGWMGSQDSCQDRMSVSRSNIVAGDPTLLTERDRIVNDLVVREYERLMRDHYSDDPRATCDGCAEAALLATMLTRSETVR